MLTIDNFNGIDLTRGDNAELHLTLTSGGETYDYSNDTVYFGVKRTAQDNELVLEKEVEDGAIVLTHDDTKDLAYGDYLYSVRLAHTNEDEEVEIYTPIAGARFSLGWDIIRELPAEEPQDNEGGEG